MELLVTFQQSKLKSLTAIKPVKCLTNRILHKKDTFDATDSMRSHRVHLLSCLVQKKLKECESFSMMFLSFDRGQL